MSCCARDEIGTESNYERAVRLLKEARGRGEVSSARFAAVDPSTGFIAMGATKEAALDVLGIEAARRVKSNAFIVEERAIT